ncbi:ATP synthase gamma chain [Rickettsiales bacterium]|nr:ATP synthase gamma chain [Rickettsiales bacterium]
MQNLKALKLRINSAKSANKITGVMKVISAAKLRKARQQLGQTEQNLNLILQALNHITSTLRSEENLPDMLHSDQEAARELCLVFASDRGLCGGFNSSIAKTVRKNYNQDLDIICIGNKIYEMLQKDCRASIIGYFKNIPTYQTAREITQKIFASYSQKKYRSCKAFYAIPRSITSQEATCLQIMPLSRSTGEADDHSDEDKREFEPDKLSALNSLLPVAISAYIYKILTESLVSEHSARMTAMDNATRNAKSMIEKLTINYNRSRQAEITKDLIEVTSGAEALTK